MDEQDHQHCKVTVRAGGGPGKGYEQFVANSLEKEKLEEVTCNLDPELKGEALVTFLDAVKDGFSIKDCIARVQSQVLHKVPNVRNKFFIKFVYDNQLQIEIGVNKFKNGNAQFYHKLGVQPKETPEKKEEKEVRNIRKFTMNELQGSGGFPYVRLKKQVTNDKSAPLVSGHVINRHGAWEDSEPPRQPDQPPNPTNRQTSRQSVSNYRPDEEDHHGAQRVGLGRPLGDIMKNHKPSSVKLRSRSVGRPMKEMREEDKIELRDRSASPLPSEIRKRGALGDCFRTGIKPTQSMLRSSGSPIVNSKTTPKFGNNKTFNISGDNDKGRMKNIKIEVRPQGETEDYGEEWNENYVKEDEIFSPIKIEEIFSPVESTESKQTFPFPSDYRIPISPFLNDSYEDIDQTEEKILTSEPEIESQNYKYSPYLVTQPDESENDRVETITNKISKMNVPTAFVFPTYNKIQPLGPQWDELQFPPIVPLPTTMGCPPSIQESPLQTQFAQPQIKQTERWVSIPIQRA